MRASIDLPSVPGMRVLRRLGSNPDSRVFLCELSEDPAKQVAARIFPASRGSDLSHGLEVWRRIAAIQGREGSQRLVEVVGRGILAGGGAWIATAWHPLGSLKGEMTARGTLDEFRVLSVGIQLATALSLLHAEGIAHGDLKPSSILRRHDGGVCLAGFKEAFLAGEPASSPGNSGFGAPEQRAAIPVEASGQSRLDIYALGAILYACLVGHPPRPERPDLFALERARVSRQTQEAILGALEKNPADRHADAAIFGAELVEAQKKLSAQASPAVPAAEYERVENGESTASHDSSTWTAADGAVRASPSKDESSGCGKYQLLEEIARGGMGVVYRAHHPELQRDYALKRMLFSPRSRDAIVRFMREAQTMARLDHPGIIAIHEVAFDGDSPYLVMDLIHGGPLSSQCKQGPLPLRQAAHIAECIARAIDHAHRRGVIHRDLKPSNILIDRDGSPKVGDFGLARGTNEDSDLTRSGAVIGTASYMSPEQAAGDRDRVGTAADVYGIGAILYEMVTGRPPFVGAYLEVLAAIRDSQPTPPETLRPGLPRDLSAIISQALAKDASRRYASAGALADDLKRFSEGVPVSARPVSTLERSVSWVRRHRGVSLLLGLCLILAFVALVMSLVTLRARAIEEAKELEFRGIARLALGPDEGARADLRRAIALDAGRVHALRVLAGIELEDGALDEAERLLEQAARIDPWDARIGILRARLAEAYARPDAALAIYRQLFARGEPSEELCRRLARAVLASAAGQRAALDEVMRVTDALLQRAADDPEAYRLRTACLEALGQVVCAEEERWRLFRVDPDDLENLSFIVWRLIEQGEVESLLSLWREAFRRLGQPGDPSLLSTTEADGIRFEAAVTDPSLPAARRLRGAIGLSLFGVPSTRKALQAVASDPTTRPFLRDAAVSSLVGMSPEYDLERWGAHVTAAETGSPGHALTLLERAPLLSGEEALFAAFAQAREPLFRACVPLARLLALFASNVERAAPDAAEHAATVRLIDRLSADQDPRVCEAARRASAALWFLCNDVAEAANSPDEAAGLLLALRLSDLPPPGLRGLRPRVEAALARSIELRPSARLCVERARRRLEASDPGWEADLASALAFPEPPLAARFLAAVTGLHAGNVEPLAWLESADPGAAARAVELAGLRKQLGLITLDGPNGTTRFVFPAVPPSEQLALLQKAFEITSIGLEQGAGGPVFAKESHLQLRFPVEECYRVETEGLRSLTLAVGAIRDQQSGVFVSHRTNLPSIQIDLGDPIVGTLITGQVEPFRLTLGRMGFALDSGRTRRLFVHAVSRQLADGGVLAISTGFDFKARLSGLLLVARPAHGASTDLMPSEEPPLPQTSPSGELTLRKEGAVIRAPRDLAGLRREGAVLRAKGAWCSGSRACALAGLESLSGDVVIEARLAFKPAWRDQGAGLALASEGSSHAVRLLLTQEGVRSDQCSLSLSLQRPGRWEIPATRIDLGSAETLCLRLHRKDDFIYASVGKTFEAMQPIAEPVRFELRDPITASLIARNFHAADTGQLATFDLVEIRGYRTPR